MERPSPPPDGSPQAWPDAPWRSHPWRRIRQVSSRAMGDLGQWVIGRCRALDGRIEFLGRTLIALGRMVSGRSRHLDLGFVEALRQAGVETLPVVALFGLASGAVLAMLATQQLDKFAVPILAPKLVGIVVLRELGALMTGIALAGRLASAFSAEVATAMAGPDSAERSAAGIDPVDNLVAPRVLALVLSGPLLVAYASAMALVGATVVGSELMEYPARQYFDTMVSALTLKHAISALVKGTIFGFVAGVTGCYHGFYCGKGSAAVGRAVRDAVVGAVVAVAVADVALVFIFRWVRL